MGGNHAEPQHHAVDHRNGVCDWNVGDRNQRGCAVLGRANAGSPDEPLYPDFGNRIPAQRSSAAQGIFFRRPIQVSLSHTEDLERLRRQAERALRLARGINDERAAQALRAHAADLLEQVKSVEQQEQLSKDENKKD